MAYEVVTIALDETIQYFASKTPHTLWEKSRLESC